MAMGCGDGFSWIGLVGMGGQSSLGGKNARFQWTGLEILAKREAVEPGGESCSREIKSDV